MRLLYFSYFWERKQNYASFMLPRFVCCLLFAGVSVGLYAQNAAPVIQNFSAEIDWPTQALTLHFDVQDAENDQ